QAAELRVGAAELAVRDDLAVPATSVADEVAEPVVERVVAVLRKQVLASGVGGRDVAALAPLDAVDVADVATRRGVGHRAVRVSILGRCDGGEGCSQASECAKSSEPASHSHRGTP